MIITNFFSICNKISQKINTWLLLLLLSCTPVREVCPNDELVMLQPQIGTSPYLGSVDYCYVVILLSHTPYFPSATRCTLGGATHCCPFSPSIYARPVTTQYHPPTWVSPVYVPAYLYHLLPDSDTSSRPPPSPVLTDYRRRTLSTTKISSNVAFSCF